MKKTVIFSLMLMALTFGVRSEESEIKPWSFSGFFSQQLNQMSFSNWAAGGENSFASTTMATFSANLKNDNFTWENSIAMAYGLTWTKSNSTRKSEDKIDFLSKIGRPVSDKLSISALANFKTQFTKGFNYAAPETPAKISNFLAPGFLIASVGIDYKPSPCLSIYLSPATGKFTFVNDTDLSAVGAFGVEPGKTFRPEFGALAKFAFKKEVVSNVNVVSTLDLFNNFTDKNKDNRKRVDVNWDTNINMKVNQYITAVLGFSLLYDWDTKFTEMVNGVPTATEKVQFKQMFGVGLSFSL